MDENITVTGKDGLYNAREGSNVTLNKGGECYAREGANVKYNN